MSILERAVIQTVDSTTDAVILLRREAKDWIVAHINTSATEREPRLAKAHGRNWRSVLGLAELSSQREVVHQAVRKAESTGLSVHIGLPYGTHTITLKIVPIQAETGAYTHLVCTYPSQWSIQAAMREDTTVESLLQGSERAYQRLVESCPIPIIVHRNFRITYANPIAAKRLGVATLRGANIMDFFTPSSHNVIGTRIERLSKGDSLPTVEATLVSRTGEPIDVEITSISMMYDGAPAVLSLVQDITEKKKNIRTLEHLAYYDPLTELPNRRLLRERTITALSESMESQQMVVIFFMDLDGFKSINDSYGHEAGDDALHEMALRLRTCIDPSRDILGRLAGDEFSITRQRTNIEDAEELAKSLLASFQDPIRVGSTDVRVKLSIGLSLFPKDGTSYDALLRAADTAMYVAKQGGGQAYAWH
ncbi:sensor domain-containing diguanylate cyclase [Alicyclobacillus dauci]|uniref:Sensor domain-containing diguanylate cyclase n=1 Tax=Alicyclobacillus dauci TaxID=1475485 RepID=A0ABY6Z1C8_9BACL|nr:sensor domain-containing diguanylate cyclase [Alicyclobacillus dauci]WAH36698.1 sensor domain-containing diguanylate cyclase [Alicyclobacillus dauci]